jgi:hypothetical protein
MRSLIAMISLFAVCGLAVVSAQARPTPAAQPEQTMVVPALSTYCRICLNDCRAARKRCRLAPIPCLERERRCRAKCFSHSYCKRK